MNLNAAQIDRIVQEVVRQLQTQSQPASGSQTDSLAMSSADALASSDSRPPSDSTSPKSGTLVVHDRVITGELLRGRLKDVSCLQIGCRAIVTPLVGDLLRERKIRLERQTARTTGAALGAHKSSSSASPVKGDKSRLRRIGVYVEPLATGAIWVPPTNLPIDWISMQRKEEVTQQLQNRSNSLCCAFAITRDWATLVRNANQQTAIRAAVVWSASSVQQAIAQIEPNLLVIDAVQTDLSDIDEWVTLALNR